MKNKKMKKENKTKKEIDTLYKKIAPLQRKINELEEAEMFNVQMPRIQKMVGYYLRSTYESERYYGKILDLVEDKNGYPEFILEVIYISKEGNPYIHLDNIPPHLNKEWWDTEIPINGWEKCSEDEYQTFKAKILNEISTQKSLRKFIQRRRY